MRLRRPQGLTAANADSSEGVRSELLALHVELVATLKAITEFQAELADARYIRDLFSLCVRSDVLWAHLDVLATAVENFDESEPAWVTGEAPAPDDTSKRTIRHVVTAQTSMLPRFDLLFVVPATPDAEVHEHVRFGREMVLSMLTQWAFRYGERAGRLDRERTFERMDDIALSVTAPAPADVVALGASALRLQREKRDLFDEYLEQIVRGWNLDGASVHGLSFNRQYLLAAAGTPAEVLPYDVDRSSDVHTFQRREAQVPTDDGVVVSGFPFDFRQHRNWGLLTLVSSFELSEEDKLQLDMAARAIGTMIESAASARQRSVLNRQNRKLDQRVSERTALLEAEQEKVAASAATLERLLVGMSHAMQSPLASVIGMLELLGQTPDTQQEAQWLASATRSAERMQHISRRLIRYVEADPAALAARLTPGTVRQLLFGAEDRWRERLATSGHLLTTSVGAAGDFPVGSSPDLDLVLDEVLANVGLHADAGMVSMRAALEGDGTVLIDIVDPGPGFDAPGSTPVLAASELEEAGDHGAQLGLLLVERVVTELGGTFEVGRPARSTVRIALPVAGTTDQPAPAE